MTRIDRPESAIAVSPAAPPVRRGPALHLIPGGAPRAPPRSIDYRPQPPGPGSSAARWRPGVESDQPHESRSIAADRDLMVAIAAGDDAAFARVVGAETPRLVRFARSMLSASPAEAEEVVQEAMLRLWQYAEDWQPSGRVSTWLHQVVYRLCIDSIRRRRPSVEIGSIEAELEDDTPPPDSALIRADDVETVRAAIARLPERQRTALVLCHFQEMGQAEAAAVMDIGESAYESLLARARRRLRVWLAADEGKSK
jgi:RNA polymerase sigma-70 factor (ECF subfamily)